MRGNFHADLMVETSPSLSKSHMRRGAFGGSSHEATGESWASGIRSTSWTLRGSCACCERLKTSATRRSGTRKRLDMNPSLSRASCWRTPGAAHHRQAPSRISARSRPFHRETRSAHLVQPLRRSLHPRPRRQSRADGRERRGHAYDKPVPTMRRYLDALYENPSNTADWPLMIAALGPLMLKLAAERTAGHPPV